MKLGKKFWVRKRQAIFQIQRGLVHVMIQKKAQGQVASVTMIDHCLINERVGK